MPHMIEQTESWPATQAAKAEWNRLKTTEGSTPEQIAQALNAYRAAMDKSLKEAGLK